MTDKAIDLQMLLAACAAEADAGAEGPGSLDLRDSALAVQQARRTAALGKLGEALAHMVRVEATDLHLKAGSRPRVRVLGQLLPAPLPALSAADCEALVSLTSPPSRPSASPWPTRPTTPSMSRRWGACGSTPSGSGAAVRWRSDGSTP